MDARQLRDEAQKLRTKADSRHKEAGKFNMNADAHANDGDDTRASVDAQQAERLESEVLAMEQQADQLDAALTVVSAKVLELNNEKKKAEDEYKARIDQIEKEQRRLSGGSTTILT